MKTHVATSSDSILHASSTHLAVSCLGTVLWIGERRTMEFRQAYQYCENASSQIAHRRNLEEAILRPAQDVQRVVVARVDRESVRQPLVETLSRKHDGAQWISIEGPLCAGASRRQTECPLVNVAGATRCYSHQWQTCLPAWLQSQQETSTITDDQSSRRAVRSVGVICDQYHNAETLLDLAESWDVTSVWFPSANRLRMRNLDVLWWDDSVASAAMMNDWKLPLSREGSSPLSRAVMHVWLTHCTCPVAAVNAKRCGMSVVITKPLRIESLLSTLCDPRSIETGRVGETIADGQRAIANQSRAKIAA